MAAVKSMISPVRRTGCRMGMWAALAVLGLAHAAAAKELVAEYKLDNGMPKEWATGRPPCSWPPAQVAADPKLGGEAALAGVAGNQYGEVAIPVPVNFRMEWELRETPGKGIPWCCAILEKDQWRASAECGPTPEGWQWSCNYFIDNGVPRYRGEFDGGRVAAAKAAEPVWRKLAVEKVGREWAVELDGVRSVTTAALPSAAAVRQELMLHMTVNADTRIRGVKVFDLDKEAAGKPAGLRFRYYPSLKKLLCAPYANVSDAASASVSIKDRQGKEVVRRDNLPLVKEFIHNGFAHTLEGLIDVPDFPDGDYSVAVGARTADGKELWTPDAGKFTRKHFPWEGNTLGITDEVFPPFTPLEVKGEEVSCVLRKYKMSRLGLLSSVKAAGNVSAGGEKELLAAPMALRVDDGRALEGKGRFVEVKPHRAVFEGKAVAENVTVAARSVVEVDGCVKVELTLAPGKEGRELKALWLEIPLKDAEAPLWHLVMTGLRNNPAGETPKGEGVVWNNRLPLNGDKHEANEKEWRSYFKPYIWLGAEERGLCWFADNDAGWMVDPNPDPKQAVPCQELVRKDGVLTLRIRLVQVPVTLDGPRTICFGLMASPVKPMRPDWRRIVVGGRQKNAPSLGWMGSEYWGASAACASRYPINRDFSIIDAMRDARLGKAVDTEAFKKEFAARNLPPGEIFGVVAWKPRQQFIDLLGISIQNANNYRTGDYYTVYWEEHVLDGFHEEVKTFHDEWSGAWSGPLPVGERCAEVWIRSYNDFATWYGAEFVKRGIGLYFDNTFLCGRTDLVTTDAYRLPDGALQPTAGIWMHRDYKRRIWNLHQQLGPKNIKPMMMMHMSNTHILPYMGWNDSNLDLEWRYEMPPPMQTKFSHALLRAESLGRQTGNIPVVLARMEPQPASAAEALCHKRTLFGAMLVHDIKPDQVLEEMMTALNDFGYGLPECQVFNYWDAAGPCKSGDPEAKTLLVKNGGKLLLLVCTWNPQAARVDFTLDLRALGVSPKAAVDAEADVCLPELKKRLKEIGPQLEGWKANLAKAKQDLAAAATPEAKAEAEGRKGQAEGIVANIANNIAVDEAEAALIEKNPPPEFDPASGRLSLQLDGYDVRMIRLGDSPKT